MVFNSNWKSFEETANHLSRQLPADLPNYLLHCLEAEYIEYDYYFGIDREMINMIMIFWSDALLSLDVGSGGFCGAERH